MEVRIAVGKFLGAGDSIENTKTNFDSNSNLANGTTPVSVNVNSSNYIMFEKLVDNDKTPLYINIDSIKKISEGDDKNSLAEPTQIYTHPSTRGGASKRRLSKKAKHARRGRRNSRKSL